MISLPTRLGGLGILNPLSTADSQFNSSLIITAPLVSSIILSSNESISTILADISQRKADVRKDRRLQLSTLAQELYSIFPSSLQRCLDVAGEKSASTWLTVLPSSIHGFALNKGAFRDALCLKYGWIPSRLPSHCVCGNTFTVDHCFNCKCGGFPSIRHNEIRDIIRFVTMSSLNPHYKNFQVRLCLMSQLIDKIKLVLTLLLVGFGGVLMKGLILT